MVRGCARRAPAARVAGRARTGRCGHRHGVRPPAPGSGAGGLSRRRSVANGPAAAGGRGRPAVLAQRARGLRAANVRLTGFPLPHELSEPSVLRRNLAARLSRLRVSGELRRKAEAELGPLPAPDGPPLIVFAVGGAGAQVPLARKLVRGLAEKI